MPLDSKRKGDLKVLVGATVAVLLVGLFIAGAMFATTRGNQGVRCGQLNLGLATGVRLQLNDGPFFTTGGGHCSFWVALENGDIVAYKATQPATPASKSCTLALRPKHWSCDGKTVPVSRIARYPVSIQTVHGVDTVVVNLGTLPPGSSPSTATSKPTTS